MPPGDERDAGAGTAGAGNWVATIVVVSVAGAGCSGTRYRCSGGGTCYHSLLLAVSFFGSRVVRGVS